MNEITFKGQTDGIYETKTAKELSTWKSNGWIWPRIDLKKGDIDDNGARNSLGERGAENHHEGNQVLDYQKLLKDIGAYPNKLDGWVGPKMEAAVIWLKECIEKCEFVDLSGKKAMLDLNDIIKGHRPKHADEALKKAAEKIKENNIKVRPNNSHSFIMRNGKKVPFYYQLDTKWKDDVLGKNRTIGQAGCCVTSLAMVLKYYGRNVNPEILDEYLDTHSGYAGDAVYFDVALKCEEGSNNKLAYNGNRVKAGWATILDDRINQNTPTIARVKYGSSLSSGGDHYVVIIGKTNDGKYIMNDPGASDGNGSDNPIESNIIGDTKRKSGYSIVWIDCITENVS
jgi:hypothetical protein